MFTITPSPNVPGQVGVTPPPPLILPGEQYINLGGWRRGGEEDRSQGHFNMRKGIDSTVLLIVQYGWAQFHIFEAQKTF